VAVVARQVDRDDVRIVSRQPPHRRPATIARAVIDEHQFIVRTGDRARRRAQPLVQLDQAGFLVEARNDDRNLHGCVL